MFAKLDGWLDQGYGACLLRNSEISEIVIKTLRHFDGVRYFLDEHVVMPNHIHTLVMPMEGQPLKNILQTWKSYSSNRINDLLGNQGRFWMAESFDRIVRSWEDLERIRLSIRDNPKKARLRESDFLLGKGIGIKNPRKIAF
jgi:REP element-mobilizing transposase RayT